MQKKQKSFTFILFFAHLFVPLRLSSRRYFRSKKQKSFTFILFFAHLFVPLRLSSRRYFRSKKQKSFTFILFFAHLFVPLQRFSPDGGIGRRAGLKHQWGNPCRFDPGSGYELTSEKCCNFQGYSTYFFPNS